MVRSCEQTAVSKVYCTSIDSVSYSDTSLTKVSICVVVGQSKSTMYSWEKSKTLDMNISMKSLILASECFNQLLLAFAPRTLFTFVSFFPLLFTLFFFVVVLPRRVTMLKLYSIGFCQGLLHQTTVRSEPVGCDQTFLR